MERHECWERYENFLADLIKKGIDKRPSVPLVIPKQKGAAQCKNT